MGRIALLRRRRLDRRVELHLPLFHTLQVGARPESLVRRHAAGLPPEVLLDSVHAGKQLGVFVGPCDHVAVHDVTGHPIRRRHRRVVRGISAFLVRHHRGIRVGLGQLRRALDPVLLLRCVGLAEPLQHLTEFLLTVLRVGQLGRQLPRLPLAPQHRVGGIGSLRLAEHLPDPRLQLSQCRLDSFRRPGVKAAGVGLHPCAIEGDFHQLDQPDRHRQPANVLEQLLQRLLELRAEFAQGSVVDPAPLGQPHEVDVVATGVFQLPARSDTPHQPIEDHARHHPWRNRRLPQAAIVLLLPGRPVLGEGSRPTAARDGRR